LRADRGDDRKRPGTPGRDHGADRAVIEIVRIVYEQHEPARRGATVERGHIGCEQRRPACRAVGGQSADRECLEGHVAERSGTANPQHVVPVVVEERAGTVEHLCASGPREPDEHHARAGADLGDDVVDHLLVQAGQRHDSHGKAVVIPRRGSRSGPTSVPSHDVVHRPFRDRSG
jgi:hypothetical protein